MVQQLFEALFVVTLVSLVVAPVVGGLLLAWPRRSVDRGAVRIDPVHARA
jgi:hypothetical protein